ncbi:hypothetical protein TNCV_3809741 [Trichonephila clavipes]|nr:hypothetical protein TNCV_3809741 [Trichonephila clavipes]
MASDRVNVEAMRNKLYREALCGKSIGLLQSCSSNCVLRDAKQPIEVNDHFTKHPTREQPQSHAQNPKISHPDEACLPRLPDSIVQPIAAMPLSRQKKLTFAKSPISKFYQDMGLRTVLQSGCPKENAYSRFINTTITRRL